MLPLHGQKVLWSQPFLFFLLLSHNIFALSAIFCLVLPGGAGTVRQFQRSSIIPALGVVSTDRDQWHQGKEQTQGKEGNLLTPNQCVLLA